MFSTHSLSAHTSTQLLATLFKSIWWLMLYIYIQYFFLSIKQYCILIYLTWALNKMHTTLKGSKEYRAVSLFQLLFFTSKEHILFVSGAVHLHRARLKCKPVARSETSLWAGWPLSAGQLLWAVQKDDWSWGAARGCHRRQLWWSQLGGKRILINILNCNAYQCLEPSIAKVTIEQIAL